VRAHAVTWQVLIRQRDKLRLMDLCASPFHQREWVAIITELDNLLQRDHVRIACAPPGRGRRGTGEADPGARLPRTRPRSLSLQHNRSLPLGSAPPSPHDSPGHSAAPSPISASPLPMISRISSSAMISPQHVSRFTWSFSLGILLHILAAFTLICGRGSTRVRDHVTGGRQSGPALNIKTKRTVAAGCEI